MTAAAAAAWIQFADASAAALAAPACMPKALGPDLAAAVDGVAAHGLARLVPSQLLDAAAAALQSRLAHLHDALAALFAAVGDRGSAPAADANDDSEEGDDASLTPEVEASLAKALRVGGVRGALHFALPCLGRGMTASGHTLGANPGSPPQDICGAVESCGELLLQLCERTLRSQAATLSVADRVALLSAGQRFRREAAAAMLEAEPGRWAGGWPYG